MEELLTFLNNNPDASVLVILILVLTVILAAVLQNEEVSIGDVTIKIRRKSQTSTPLGFILNTYPYSQDPDFFKTVTSLIEKANKITLIGTSLNLLQEEPILDKLIKKAQSHNSIEITIGLANPNSPHIEERLVEEGISTSNTRIAASLGRTRILNNISRIRQKLTQYNNPNNVQLHLFEHYPTFATLIFDEEIFIYPYAYKTLGNESPVIHLKYDKTRKETQFFVDNANKIIEDSIPIKDWIKIDQSPQYFSSEWIAAAIYIIPERNEPFYRFGSSILGYDIWEEYYSRKRDDREVVEDRIVEYQNYVGEAINFGFHATIGDALYFVNQAEIDRIKAELELLANKLPPFTLDDLKIVDRSEEEGDIVIKCRDKTGVCEALHYELIHCFYRSAISSTYQAKQTDKLERAKKGDLRDRTDFMIKRYKAPYILQEFNFHFTLCTSPPSEESERKQLLSELKTKFNQNVLKKEIKIQKICLLVKRRGDNRWKIEEEYPLHNRQ